jgi:hypothetical protein
MQESRGSVRRCLRPDVVRTALGGSTIDTSVTRARAGSAASEVLRPDRSHGAVPVVSALDLVVLDLVGRHPFLFVDTLADVLGREVHGVRTRQAALSSREREQDLPGIGRDDADCKEAEPQHDADQREDQHHPEVHEKRPAAQSQKEDWIDEDDAQLHQG